MPIGLDPRVARVARRLNAAAERYDAPVGRVALRALRLRARGWRLGDMAAAGLLDPRAKPSSKPWAVVPRHLERLQEAINPPEAVPLCEDKRRFDEACRRFGLPTPALAATLERAPDAGATARDWAALLAERTPAEFVVKPVDGHRGIGVRVLARGPEGAVEHGGRALSWAELGDELAREPHPAYVVQERLHPHPELVRLTGSPALQTIRVMTLVEPDGQARIMSWGIRLAIGDQPIDSFQSGATGNLWATLNGDGSMSTPITVGPGRLRVRLRAAPPGDRHPAGRRHRPVLGGGARPLAPRGAGLRHPPRRGVGRRRHARRGRADRGERLVVAARPGRPHPRGRRGPARVDPGARRNPAPRAARRRVTGS